MAGPAAVVGLAVGAGILVASSATSAGAVSCTSVSTAAQAGKTTTIKAQRMRTADFIPQNLNTGIPSSSTMVRRRVVPVASVATGGI